MDMKKIRTYILEDEFEIRIVDNKIDVLNYDSIYHFDSNKIIIKHKMGSITINGRELVVSRLLKDEMLITGIIKNLELRNNHEE